MEYYNDIGISIRRSIVSSTRISLGSILSIIMI